MDSGELRRVARQVQELGDDVRRLSDRMSSAGQVDWRSRAATGFRALLAAEVAAARLAALRLDEAVVAMHRHALGMPDE
jgi:hypothetical protein